MLSKIDKYIIKKVKERRKELGISQSQLAFELGVSNSYIGMVESEKFEHKYNTTHLNELAKILNCSPKDFMPEKPLK